MVSDLKRMSLRLNRLEFLSEECKSWTEKAQCSVCDGDVGTARRIGICPEMCESWHQNCLESYITLDQESETAIDFTVGDESKSM